MLAPSGGNASGAVRALHSLRGGYLLFLSQGGCHGPICKFVVANAGLTSIAVIFNRGARFIDQDLLLHLGHKHHFAFRIFNFESLKASEFI